MFGQDDLCREVRKPIRGQHGLGREAEIAPLARVDEVERELVIPEAAQDIGREILARTAQQGEV